MFDNHATEVRDCVYLYGVIRLQYIRIHLNNFFNTLLVSALLMHVAACTDKDGSESSSYKAPQEEALRKSNEKRFDEWLVINGLTRESFKDSIGVSAHWMNWEPLSHIDSVDIWYPSPDSSYFLITNFDRKRKKTLQPSDDVICSRFMDATRGLIHPGLCYMLTIDSIALKDYLWYDNRTVYMLMYYKGDSSFRLEKTPIGGDSTYLYSTVPNLYDEIRKYQKQRKVN